MLPAMRPSRAQEGPLCSDRMFQQDMKESGSRELSIEDVQNDTVEAMLEYHTQEELQRK